jgi:hypothetical protein
MSQRRKAENKPENQQPFSEELRIWLKTPGRKTLADLNSLFGEKTFAIAFLLLMALPALPLPTGGVTHLTELITMLLCLELIAGRRSAWLPKRWLSTDMGKPLSGKAAGRLIAFIQWFEQRSRRRWSGFIAQRTVLSAIGVVLLAFAAAAFVAPPFSGLDTLPSLGAVVISLGLILEDGLVVLFGLIIGVAGIGLEIAAGAALYDSFRHLF